MTGPSWANGCSECERGLVLPPPVPKDTLSIFATRQVQAQNGELTFCECRAGQAMKRVLLGGGQVAERVPTMGMAAVLLSLWLLWLPAISGGPHISATGCGHDGWPKCEVRR